MFKTINNYVSSLNNSKYLAGILMIVLNILSKYINIKFTKIQETYIKNLLGRQLLIFTVAFVATRDVVVSLILTLAFIVSVDYLLNEDSGYCIIPTSIQERIQALEDSLLDDDDYPSEVEIEKAHKTLEKMKTMHYKQNQDKRKVMFSTLYNNLIQDI